VNWTQIAAIVVPVIVAALGVLGSIRGARHSGRAAIMQATSDVKKTQDVNWAAYTEQLRKDNEGLQRRIERAEGTSLDRLTEVEAHSKRRLEEAREEYNAELVEVKREASERLGKVEKALGDWELRTRAAEVRASKAEELYSLAIVYLRHVFSWAHDHMPGLTLPAPPPELGRDL
jgi:hypothetical protein